MVLWALSCSKPLNWMLTDWIKSSVLPFSLLYQPPFLLYSLLPLAFFRSPSCIQYLFLNFSSTICNKILLSLVRYLVFMHCSVPLAMGCAFSCLSQGAVWSLNKQRCWTCQPQSGKPTSNNPPYICRLLFTSFLNSGSERRKHISVLETICRKLYI